LRALPFVRDVTAADEGVNVIVEDGGAAVPELLRVLGEAGLGVARLALTSPTLDDVFLKHTGHSIRQEELNPGWRSARGWGPVRPRR
jgi:ABC-2 type transport system ATP-binding protein